MTSPDLVRRFLTNAGNAAAGTHTVSDVAGLRRILSEIVPGIVPVFCPGLTDKEKAAVPSLPCLAADYAGATATVEEVYGAIAETGSLVCVSSGGRAVQAGLLPAHHVAIVSRERIFATLDDCFASFKEDPPMRSGSTARRNWTSSYSERAPFRGLDAKRVPNFLREAEKTLGT
jgi:hypothetical protein